MHGHAVGERRRWREGHSVKHRRDEVIGEPHERKTPQRGVVHPRRRRDGLRLCQFLPLCPVPGSPEALVPVEAQAPVFTPDLDARALRVRGHDAEEDGRHGA